MHQLINVNTVQNNMENSISATKNYIKNRISGIGNKISADISAIKSAHSQLEQKIMDKLDKQLKIGRNVVEQQAQKLREFNCAQETRQDVGVDGQDIEIAQRDRN
jgi:carbonic anhydrase